MPKMATMWSAMHASRNIDSPPSELYLDLLKRCLTREIFVDCPSTPTDCDLPRQSNREDGPYCWSIADTMIGSRRLDNLHECILRILADGTPGDLMEAGVWRGGATIFMRAALAAYGDRSRRVIVADSFRGLPRPDADRYPADADVDLSNGAELAVPENTVRHNFRRYGMLDDRVIFVPGWFHQSLPDARVDRLAVLRIDADMYQSTIDVLNAMYAKVSDGGFVIVDDYGAIPACRAAVDDFRARHAIEDELFWVDRTAVYWRTATRTAAPERAAWYGEAKA